MLESPTHLLLLGARLHRGLLAERLRALGMSPGEEVVLAELFAEDGLTQAELARRLALRRSTVTIVLRTMERNGLVERASDDRDGRVVRVRCSARAIELRAEIEAAWNAVEASLLAGLSARERADLRRLLARVRHSSS